MKLLRLLPLLALAVASGCFAPEQAASAPKSAKPKPYVLSMCLVSDEKLAKGDPIILYQGREIRVCCDGCVKDFQKEPEKYLKLIEAEELRQAAEKAKRQRK